MFTQTNYMRGRSFEYRVMNDLRKKGYYVIRSFGSHGLFDIIAVPPITESNMRARLIQCKVRNYLHPDEKRAILDAAYKLHGEPILATKDKNKHLLYQKIEDMNYAREYYTKQTVC